MDQSKNLLIGGRSPTYLDDKNGLVVLGLYADQPLRAQKVEVIDHFFLHPRVKVFHQDISPKRIPLSKASLLKIPNKVWKNQLSADDLQRKKEKDQVRRLLLRETSEVQLPKCWSQPLNTIVVSKFASPRTLPNGKSYYHSGVDLRGWTGTRVKAMANGVVALAENMIVPGINIIIDHGQGVFSRYMHLSELRVKVGDPVEIGQIIGLTGATGRVEAPHLHWEVYWKGWHADPRNFIQVMNQFCPKNS